MAFAAVVLNSCENTQGPQGGNLPGGNLPGWNQPGGNQPGATLPTGAERMVLWGEAVRACFEECNHKYERTNGLGIIAEAQRRLEISPSMFEWMWQDPAIVEHMLRAYMRAVMLEIERDMHLCVSARTWENGALCGLINDANVNANVYWDATGQHIQDLSIHGHITWPRESHASSIGGGGASPVYAGPLNRIGSFGGTIAPDYRRLSPAGIQIPNTPEILNPADAILVPKLPHGFEPTPSGIYVHEKKREIVSLGDGLIFNRTGNVAIVPGKLEEQYELV